MKYVFESRLEFDVDDEGDAWERLANYIADATSADDLYVLVTEDEQK